MKVCIFTETYHPVVGGGETQARALADGLTAQGLSVHVITRRSSPELASMEQYGQVTVYRVPPAGRQQLRKWALMFTSLPALFRHQHDLLYISGFRIVGLTAVPVSRLLGRTCILKADSLGEMSGDYFTAGLGKLGIRHDFLLFRLFLKMRNRILRQAHGFVAISTAIRDELLAHGVDISRIHMIPNSVDTEVFYPVNAATRQMLRRSLNLPEGAQIVIYTGRLVSYKGLPLLLDIWQRVAAEHTGAVLVLVGTGGMDIHNCEAELKVTVQALNLPVIFTGAVTNVSEYLRAADVFVFPSEDEAFGISVVEAMACGLPVISTDAGGLRDIVQHEENGVVISPGDGEALFTALDTLLRDPARADALGTAARTCAEALYSAESVVGRHAVLFHELKQKTGHKAG